MQLKASGSKNKFVVSYRSNVNLPAHLAQEPVRQLLLQLLQLHANMQVQTPQRQIEQEPRKHDVIVGSGREWQHSTPPHDKGPARAFARLGAWGSGLLALQALPVPAHCLPAGWPGRGCSCLRFQKRRQQISPKNAAPICPPRRVCCQISAHPNNHDCSATPHTQSHNIINGNLYIHIHGNL